MNIRQLFFLAALLSSSVLCAGTVGSDRILMSAMVTGREVPEEAAVILENRLSDIISSCGYTGSTHTDRFALVARVEVLSRDVVPTTPARISQKLGITFMVGDVVGDKIYSSCTVNVAGIGENETKAYISAFSKITKGQKALAELLADARERLVAYYTDHCSEIIADAETLASMQKYDEAIFKLVSVPDVCADCYRICQKKAVALYQQKIDHDAITALSRAKTVWLQQPDADGARIVAEILGEVNPKAGSYGKVEAFRGEVADRLDADARREYEFRLKQYNDRQARYNSIIDACKAVGTAFAGNRPQSVVKNIVQKW